MIIPSMLYFLNSFGQRIISLNHRQLAVFNIPMRTQYYFNNPSLETLNYASFAVMKDRFVYIIGGYDSEKLEGEYAPKTPSQNSTYIKEIPKQIDAKKKIGSQLELKMEAGPIM